MAEVTAALVKELRDATNVSMMECKRALVESGGDVEKAKIELRKKGLSFAASKSGRAAKQGLIGASIKNDGKLIGMAEVRCETDFVVKNDNFRKFVQEMAEKACDTDSSLSETMKTEVASKVQQIGENIVIHRNMRLTAGPGGLLAAYVHLGGKVCAVVELAPGKQENLSSQAFREVAKDLTLQVAAANPRFLTSKDVPAKEIASEREIYASQVKDKPPQIVEKIVDGKLRKYYSEVCLVDQPFIKEPKQTMSAFLEAKSKELGDTLVVRRFVRWQAGE